MKNELRPVPDEIKAFIQKSHHDMIAVGIDEENTLHVDVYGECGSCPYNCLSEEGELAQSIVKEFPEIKRVSLTPAISEETIDFAKKLLGLDKK